MLPLGAGAGLERMEGSSKLPRSTSGGGELSAASVSAAYANAVFCLQPWGNTATRKGFWDALSVGCVNVVFTEVGWNGTDVWFGDHREWSVQVPLQYVREGAVLRYLRSIPSTRVARLQANVLAARHRLQYSRVPGTPGGDALDVIVERLGQHFEQQLQARQRKVPVVRTATSWLQH